MQLQQTLLIVDFDDTIFPTTTFMRNFETFPFYVSETDNTVSSHTLLVPDLSAEWQAYLEKLAWHIELVLKSMRRITEDIVFVTNSSPGWIDAITEHYLPSLQPLFANIPQYHCRHRFGPSEFPKHHATSLLLEKYHPTHVIGIGDQYEDYRAIMDLCHGCCETRFIKVPLSTPANFLNQLTQISHYLTTFLYTPVGNHVFIELQEKPKDCSLLLYHE